MSKPRLFIGSSSEGIKVAHKLQESLPNAEVTVWDQDVFGLGSGTLETLLKEAPEFDFAVLVLTPDDVGESRGKQYELPRDNVLFELGLFMGVIGKSRTFIVSDSSRDLKLPSDLAGIAIAKYESPEKRADKKLAAALGPAASKIGQKVEELGYRHPDKLTKKLRKSTVTVMKGDLLACALEGRTVLLPANGYFDTTSDGNIVEGRSTLGKWLATLSAEELQAVNQDLDDEIEHAGLALDENQEKLTKPGRQSPFKTGSTVRVATKKGNLLLCAITRLAQDGRRFVASPLDEQSLDQALRELWKRLARSPVRDNFYMPLVGSGYGGMSHATSLAHILLTFRAAEARIDGRLCPSLNIVVYDKDWEDGAWVRGLFDALML